MFILHFATRSFKLFVNALPLFCGAADRSSFCLLLRSAPPHKVAGNAYIINIYYFSMVQFHTSLFN